MEIMKKCKKCNGRLRPSLIDYEKEILGDKIVIPKVEGYICVNCEGKQIDEQIEDRLQVKILEKKLKLKKEMKKHNKAILVNKIKKLRTEKDISQKKIGEALGYTEQRFGAVERNDNTPIIYAVKQIADVLGVPDTELYSLEYIPIELYDIIKDMNEDFVVIEGLPEARKDFEEYHEKYENVKEELNDYKRERRELIKRNKGKVKKIPFELTKEIKKENTNRLEEIDKEVRELNEALKKASNKVKKQELKNSVKELKKEERRLKRELSGKAKTRNYTLTEQLKKENTERIKELDQLISPLENKVKKMSKIRLGKKKKVDTLVDGKKTKNKKIKGSILRQGYCIDYSDFQNVKEVFKKYFE